ncbi:MAG: hypothetical protein JRI23_32085, partial [Deltaproteobacteria bacterium]|nr:hypothetical protein [Deltaproteobacteria bacterium]MBW2536873.1 hypothetical protein [Deltaproteobacteria bacterium]
AQSYTLVFRYDGSQFWPLPATRKLLETWKTAGPERWYDHTSCRGV